MCTTNTINLHGNITLPLSWFCLTWIYTEALGILHVCVNTGGRTCSRMRAKLMSQNVSSHSNQVCEAQQWRPICSPLEKQVSRCVRSSPAWTSSPTHTHTRTHTHSPDSPHYELRKWDLHLNTCTGNTSLHCWSDWSRFGTSSMSLSRPVPHLSHPLPPYLSFCFSISRLFIWQKLSPSSRPLWSPYVFFSAISPGPQLIEFETVIYVTFIPFSPAPLASISPLNVSVSPGLLRCDVPVSCGDWISTRTASIMVWERGKMDRSMRRRVDADAVSGWVNTCMDLWVSCDWWVNWWVFFSGELTVLSRV